LPSRTRLCTQISEYGMATRTRLCTQSSEKLAQYRWDIRYNVFYRGSKNLPFF
jgi:hypothetical protein